MPTRIGIRRILSAAGGLILLCFLLTACGRTVSIGTLSFLHYRYTAGSGPDAWGELSISRENGVYTAEVKLDGGPESLRRSVTVEEETVRKIEELFRRYEVGNWNGFSSSSRNTADGDSFSFTARMENGDEIAARGYGKRPAHYAEVAQNLKSLMGELYMKAETP